MTMSGLPTPPMEEQRSHTTKRSSKSSKSSSRISKRTSSPEHTSHVVDGRHKRVWKACERCRMKKTKVCAHLVLQSMYVLTQYSATESHLVRDVKMMDLYAQPEAERRQSSNSYREGLFTLRLSGVVQYTNLRNQVRRSPREHPVRSHRYCTETIHDDQEWRVVGIRRARDERSRPASNP